jgi:hypothetical protein
MSRYIFKLCSPIWTKYIYPLFLKKKKKSQSSKLTLILSSQQTTDNRKLFCCKASDSSSVIMMFSVPMQLTQIEMLCSFTFKHVVLVFIFYLIFVCLCLNHYRLGIKWRNEILRGGSRGSTLKMRYLYPIFAELSYIRRRVYRPLPLWIRHWNVHRRFPPHFRARDCKIKSQNLGPFLQKNNLESITLGWHGYKWRCTSWIKYLIYIF